MTINDLEWNELTDGTPEPANTNDELIMYNIGNEISIRTLLNIKYTHKWNLN